MNRHARIVSILILLSSSCQAADTDSDTGAFAVEKAFTAQMRAPAAIYWSEVPLRDAVERLSSTRKIAIWLDRRCDPGQPISFQSSQSTLEECFWALSDQEDDLDIAWIDGIVVMGPSGCPNRFATVHVLQERQLTKLPTDERKRWRSKTAMQWSRLTSPRILLRNLEKEVGRTIDGQDRVVHDLWPAKQLPPLPAFSRLGLLLAGFDLTFVFRADGSARIIPLPQNPRYARTIPRSQSEVVRQLIADHTNAELNDSQKAITLLASWRDHAWVKRQLQRKSAPPESALIRYSLRADNQPLGPFLRGLCKQLDITVSIAADAELQLGKRISFEVEGVDRTALFKTIMGQANLRYQLDEETLRVLGPAAAASQ